LEVAVIAVLVIVGIAVLLKIRAGSKNNTPPPRPKNRARKTSPAARTRPSADNNFPAVSIKFGASACQAVTDLQDKRFVKGEAPTIPLDNCNSANCTCKYTHHEIRRENDGDRRAPGSLQTTLYESTGKAERRDGGRRRSGDPK